MFKVDRRYMYTSIYRTDMMLDEVDKRCVHVYMSLLSISMISLCQCTHMTLILNHSQFCLFCF